MSAIAIIGASYLQNPLILKAKELGYETHVFAWQVGDIGERTADVFHPISIIDREAIVECCRGFSPLAVCTIASDAAALTVGYVADALGLCGNSLESVRKSTDKFYMREAFERAGIETPHHILLTEPMDRWDDDLSFPVIVKPTDRSGSRGVTKTFSCDEIPAAVENALALSFEGRAIIEEFIEGPEYSCESISYRGEHTVLAVTRKYTSDSPHFIERGHMQPSDLDGAQIQAVKEMTRRALDALHVTDGASHTEFRISADGAPRIIESGARMGGDCIGTHLVPISTGMDYLQMVIDVAVGNPPVFQRESAGKAAAIRFLFTQDDLEYLKHLQSGSPDAIVAAEVFGEVGSHEVIDSSSRFGYFILADEDPDFVEELSGL
jgi:biotin carboxylase